jgi:hypothetical protein
MLREECPLRVYILSFMKRCHEDLDDRDSGEVLKRLLDPWYRCISILTHCTSKYYQAQ